MGLILYNRDAAKVSCNRLGQGFLGGEGLPSCDGSPDCAGQEDWLLQDVIYPLDPIFLESDSAYAGVRDGYDGVTVLSGRIRVENGIGKYDHFVMFRSVAGKLVKVLY